MTHERDYQALAAIALRFQPRRIFEIGTYLGVTSDFFLALLPQSELVSIAYCNPRFRLVRRRFNNSELPRADVGSAVEHSRRDRYTQMYGDSHTLAPAEIVERFGRFDLVFIDGDHSRDGVAMDTQFAWKVLTEDGIVCWHDANPKEKYREVRTFLEQELQVHAVATKDDFIGGIACWSPEIDQLIGAQGSRGRRAPS